MCPHVRPADSLLSPTSDKDQLLEIAKANAAAMCAKAGVPIPESLRPKAILQLPLPTPSPTPLSLPLPLPLPMGMGMPNMPNMGPMGLPNIPGIPSMSNMTMSAAMASMTAATMTAALTNMGALAAMPPLAPLPTITNKPPPCLAPPTPSLNLDHIEEAKRKVTQQANIHTIKELTEVIRASQPVAPSVFVRCMSAAAAAAESVRALTCVPRRCIRMLCMEPDPVLVSFCAFAEV